MKILMAVFLIGTSVSAFAEPLSKIVGQLGFVDGEVFVDANAVQKPVSVREGSTIETKKGKATLLLGKGSVFHIGPESKMVVNQFGVKDTKEGGKHEEGELELKFGRTRALILNQGNDKKDLKIKARAATMGVRGTEVYISAPAESSQPIQFFTLEGKAEVQAAPQVAPVAVNQNEGVATSGAGGGAGGGNEVTAPSMTVSEVKEEIKQSGMESAPLRTPRESPTARAGSLSDGFGQGVPPIQFDPLQDTLSPFMLQPHYCNGVSGAVCF